MSAVQKALGNNSNKQSVVGGLVLGSPRLVSLRQYSFRVFESDVSAQTLKRYNLLHAVKKLTKEETTCKSKELFSIPYSCRHFLLSSQILKEKWTLFFPEKKHGQARFNSGSLSSVGALKPRYTTRPRCPHQATFLCMLDTSMNILCFVSIYLMKFKHF